MISGRLVICFRQSMSKLFFEVYFALLMIYSCNGYLLRRALRISGGFSSRQAIASLSLGSSSDSMTQASLCDDRINRNYSFINYHKESTRFLQYFTKYDTVSSTVSVDVLSNNSYHHSNATSQNSISVVPMTLVSKSQFDNWRSAKANILDYFAVHELMSNEPLSKFPGAKMINFVHSKNEKLSQDYVLFFDDSKVSYKSFDAIWPSIISKNLTFSLQQYDNTTDDNLKTLDSNIATSVSLSWALATYQFSQYKSEISKKISSRIVWPETAMENDVIAMASAYTIMRDLSETPAYHLGPADLHQAAVDILSNQGQVNISSVVGVRNLLDQNYPQIAAVGMAAAEGRDPRIVEVRWDGTGLESDNTPKEKYPDVVIIGKGVVFDTGGLNIKSSGGMRNMKRDMSGAAQAVGLASWIIQTKLPVKLRLLLPIVENSISGVALRPGDVIRARNGKTTEITNTDAEGRLILADALCAAVEESPDLIVDFATLTGAARVALGNDLPALFSNNQDAMMKLWNISMEINDPTWIMPLWEPMRGNLKSTIADYINAGDG